jgi:hypothetical protein
MDVLFLIVLSAAVTAGFILALRWAWAEDHKATIRERFDQVVQGWGKEK